MHWIPDPDHPVTKVCVKCGVEKHLMEFHLRRDTGRRRNDCKACRNAASRRYAAEHADELREKNRRYHAEHREEIRAVNRRWREANAEKLRAKHRADYAADPQGHYKRVREWVKNNRAWERARQRLYYHNNKHKAKVRHATRLLREIGALSRADHCADCAGKATEHHHVDYDSPFEVISLWRKCHMSRHFARWRKTGGGPVKYPEEYDSDA